ncbi:hypothetical protein V1514DRAFT_277447 [Lipomyces japonicus]|uniref:uncharacterized protein n=1 Tax=Lipomyces japonicus TaxID=56871 RepID=UPI0034CF89F2
MYESPDIPVLSYLGNSPGISKENRRNSIRLSNSFSNLQYPIGQPNTQLGISSEYRKFNALSSSSASNGRPSGSRPAIPLNGSGPGAVISEERDRYGFRKHNQHISAQEYDEWFGKYEKYLQRRRKKWDTLIKDSGIELGLDGIPKAFPSKSKKVKRYIRKGIPAEWRGAAWFWYAKGHEYLKKNAGLYQRLWQQGLAGSTPDAELIERDLHRTFPDNIHFRNNADVQTTQASSPDTPDSTSSSSRRNSAVIETAMVKALRRVLFAFSIYVPKTGYCQSLNFLAGLLLLFMDEEKAFWMLVIITQKYLPGMHEINLEGANIDQGVLMMCVKESLPSVWSKIGAGLDGFYHDDMIMRLPPITLCTAAWFMSGFIGVLPTESVVRVWDCFFYEDSKAFFRIALTIFKLGEVQIESVRDPMEIFQLVQTMPKRLIDVNTLMQSCFRRRNGFGHISQEEINSRRKFVADKRKSGSVEGTSLGSVDRGPATPGSDKFSARNALSTLRGGQPRYNHYDSLTSTYHSKSSFGKKMQMLRMGSTNMLSLQARNDYFASSQERVTE